MKRAKHISLILVALASLYSCTDYQEVVSQTGLTVDKQELSFSHGLDSQTLRVQCGARWEISRTPEWISVESINSSHSYSYEWTVSFASDQNTGYDRSGQIIISAQKETATIEVTQKGQKGVFVDVESVSLSPSELTMTIGESVTLTCTIYPSNATVKDVVWSSDDTSVATVSSSGVVTAKSLGTTAIIVKTPDGSKSAVCAVTVSPVKVTGVSLDKTSLSMTVGDSQSLVATVSPSDAADKSVTWSSSNTSVATVSSDGVVTAVAVGTATITVTTNSGGKTATCSVTVNPIKVTSVSLDKTSLSMVTGDTQTLTATVNPSNATDKSVTWSSSDTSVATVSSDGVVTAKAAGTATITVKTTDGGKTATCSVTVKSKDFDDSGNEGSNEEEMF